MSVQQTYPITIPTCFPSFRRRTIQKKQCSGPTCSFCGDQHLTRECPLENKMSSFLKKKVGMLMEHYVANNFFCPNCNRKSLTVIGTHSPSLDIKCSRVKCNRIIEVKSKCLSVHTLPSDLTVPHGNYNEFLERINQKLDVILVIYGIDRFKKEIQIREVMYLSNKILRNPEFVEIEKRPDSSLSIIKVFNQPFVPRVVIPESDRIYNFSSDIMEFKNQN
jgi:hypothetical protein